MWDRLGVLARRGYRFGYVAGVGFDMIRYFVSLLRFTKYKKLLVVPRVVSGVPYAHSVITIENDKVVHLSIRNNGRVSGFIKIENGFDRLFVYCKGSEVTKLSYWLVNGGKYEKN